MNITNMEKLITHLETQEELGFKMRNWFTHNNKTEVYGQTIMWIMGSHSCGTAACIAGHAAILAWREGAEKTRIVLTAEEWLDLDGYSLFYGDWSTNDEEKCLSSLTAEDAIKELKYLVATEKKRLLKRRSC